MIMIARRQIDKIIDRYLLEAQARRHGSKYTIAGRYRRIYHYHVRKSAGTSLNSAFWGLAGLDLNAIGHHIRVCKNGYVFVRHNRTLIERGDYFYANGHHPAYTLELPRDTFTITILRDPLKRVLSYYRYLRWARDVPAAAKQEPALKGSWKGLRRELGWLGRSFGEFLTRTPREHLMAQLNMFSPSYNIAEAVERIGQCSAVSFTEQFGDGLQLLGQQLQLPLTERHERRFAFEYTPSANELDQAREILEPEDQLIAEVKRAVIGAVQCT